MEEIKRELVVRNDKGVDVTTSLIVARVFGKEHNKVVRDIENLSCSDSFRVANFGDTPYIHPQNGQTYKMYEMTKDGFSFLVMGYSGKKAGRFKEAFINEFNKREAMLKDDDYILARSQEILQNRLKLAEEKLAIAQTTIIQKDEQIEEMSPKAEYTEKVLMSETTYTMTQVAKEFGMGASAFSEFLFKKKVIFRQSGMWMMFAKYDNEGYSAVRTKTIDKNRGSVFTSSYLVWTEKGRMFLHNKFDKELNVDTQLDMFT